MQFGVSMSLCAGEIVKHFKNPDLGEVGLSILDDFIEFARQNSFGLIEAGSASLIAADLLLPIAADIRERIAWFPVVTYHLPSGEINIAALHQGVKRAAVDETKRHIDLCQAIGIDKVVMHPGCFAAMPKAYSLMERQLRNAVSESILEIFDYCRARNMELSIENLAGNEPFFQTPEEFEPFIKQGIGMVLDTVHALTARVDPLSFVGKFGNGITEVHLTDGFRDDPVTHYPVGTGEVKCLAILNKLGEIDYEGRIVLEVDSKEDLLESLVYLKQHHVL